jgi:hypothetical protein
MMLEIVHKMNIADVAKFDPNAKCSDWVFVTAIKKVGVGHRTIKALVKSGHVEIRPSDGFGPEIRKV